MNDTNRLHKQFSDYTLVDLTHALNPNVPTWDGSCGFKKLTTSNYSDSLAHTKFQLQRLEMRAGIGTHMDAPCHCIEGGIGIAEIPLKQLVLPLIVIDVSSQAHADYEISVNDLIAFEKNHGIIPSGSLAVGYTGWSKYWNDSAKYRNADENGQMHFPSFNHKTAQVLLDRGVAGIAIDTLSPDTGADGYFPVHELFLGAGKYLIENVANAHILPSIGGYGVVLPLKVSEGAEAPIRFIAFI